MFEEVKKCPICQGDKFNLFLTCVDHSITKEQFNIVTCDNCNFKFTNPRPTVSNTPKYYESSNYISHSNQNNSLINFAYKNIRKITVKQKANLISSLSKSGKLLDYGCGTGEFLYACQKQGWDISGIEPAEIARKQANALTGKNIYGSIFDNNSQNKFNVISLWHVLEHIPDLNEAMEKLKQLLDKNGKMVIAVPNHTSYDALKYKSFWAGYDVPRHLYHFEPSTIKNLLAKYKLKIVNVIPQKLDAYYVSLLSEKYVNNKNNYFKAIINGWKSNQFAKKNNKSYSSLIYIVQHV